MPTIPDIIPEAADFTQRLNVARICTDHNLASLAETTGIGVADLSKIMIGRAMPSSTELRVLSDALHVSVDWLMTPGRFSIDGQDDYKRGALAERERITKALFREADSFTSLPQIRAVRHCAYLLQDGKL